MPTVGDVVREDRLQAKGRSGGDAAGIRCVRSAARGRQKAVQPRVTHECTQEIDPICTRVLPRDLVRDLDVTPSIDEQAGSTKRECRTRERRLRAAHRSMFDSFQEQARSVRDPVIHHCTILDENLHQPIGQGDLVGRLSTVVGHPFERAAKEVINMTGQDLGTDSWVSRDDVNPPDFRLQSGGQ